MVFAASAQEKGLTSNQEARIGITDLSKDIHYMPVNFTTGLGYNFNRTLSLGLVVDLSMLAYEKNDVRDYGTNASLGAAFGVNVVRGAERYLELVGEAGTTLGGNWTFSYYDVGLRWHDSFKKGWHPYTACGVRYYNSYTSKFDSSWSMYIGFGFKLNKN